MVEQNELRNQGQIEYGANVQKRIDEIQKRLLLRISAGTAFSNLIEYLDSEIKNPIKPKLSEVQKIYQIKKNNFYKNLKYPETTFAWGRRHKVEYIQNELIKMNNECIEECMPILMDRFHELNILKNKDQKNTSL